MSLQALTNVAATLGRQKLSLRARLLFLSGIPLAALALTIAASYSGVKHGEHTIQGVLTTDAPIADLVRRMQLDVLGIQDAYTDLSAIRAKDEMEPAFATAEAHRQSFLQSLARLRELAGQDKAEQERLQKAAAALEHLFTSGHTMSVAFIHSGTEAGYQPMKEFDAASDELRAALDPIVQARIDTFNAKLRATVAEQSRLSSWSIYAGLGIGLFSALAAYFFTRSVSHTLISIAAPIEEGAQQTADSSALVANTSKQLADRATAQAATLEETSATLEEISSMTKRNSDSAQQAKNSTGQARATADEGVAHMESMQRAMEAIQGSSAEISKIIKTIDEIAFQTNILALNAAVEAARAGEAGAGFAVVAEEVRNLAQRSARAAKETSEKIEDAVAKSAQGTQISGEVSRNFQSIQQSITEVDKLVAEIATASVEQTQGLTQLRTAVNQLDQVSQANAATAEESASAAEELSSNAALLRSSSHSLIVLVDPTVAQHSQHAQHAAAENLIEWDPGTMATGVDIIDRQHRELIDMINQLNRAFIEHRGLDEIRATTKFLTDYVKNHFALEEETMERHRCPTKDKNKAAHRKFLEDFTVVAKEVDAGRITPNVMLQLRRLVGEWLRGHICHVDTGLRQCPGVSTYTFKAPHLTASSPQPKIPAGPPAATGANAEFFAD